MARGELEIGDGKPDIAAAGGVVLRRGDDGKIRVAVIHRPKYMDWSLPKGKLESGESWIEAALREVEEEIGYRCEAGGAAAGLIPRPQGPPEAGPLLADGADRGAFEPHGEVDELRWLTRREADELLTYEHDRELVHKAIRRDRWRRLRGRVPSAREPSPA